MKSSKSALVTLLTGLALSACDSGRQPLPNTAVFVVHAAPSYLTIDFLREERVESELSYSSASVHSFDADQYDFNAEVSPPTSEEPVRLATFNATLSEDTDHYMILTESGGELDPVVVEQPVFDAGSDDSQLSVFHAGPALGAVDVYVEAPDADLAAATPLGGVDFGDRIEPLSLSPADYRVTLTEPGAPSSVVFRSNTFSVEAGQDNMLVFTDDANQSLSAANVVRVNDTPSALADVSVESALRVINGASDRESKDVVIDGDFDDPLFAGLPFATAVDYAPLPAGERDLTVTPPGNPGVLELEDTFTAARGRYHTYIFAGSDSAGLEGELTIDDRRPIANTARVRLMNVAAQFDQVAMLVVEPGESLAEAQPQLQLTAPGFSQLAPLPPGEYELGLRETESGTVVAGPVPVTLTERSIYTIMAVNGATPTSADLLLLGDFQ